MTLTKNVEVPDKRKSDTWNQSQLHLCRGSAIRLAAHFALDAVKWRANENTSNFTRAS